MQRFIGILLLCCWASGAFCKTIRVGKTELVTSIQKALQLSQNNDTILVRPGIYHEGNLVISKSIVLKGINYPVLDGDNKFEIISIKADHVTVDGFKIQHSGRAAVDDIAGIKIYDASDVYVINNILDDTNFGIFTENSKSCTIKNNQLASYGTGEIQSGNGIHCWRCDSMLIIGNTIKGHRDGIYFEFVTHSTIWRNVAAKNIRYGLHFMFSQDNNYITNIFQNNGSGVAVMYSHGVKMFNNYFEENWGDAAYGILLKDISDSYIEGNHFTKNTVGIHMEGSSRIELQKNEFTYNGWAIKIQASCDNNNIGENNFIGNTFDIGTNGSLVLNKFNGNYWDKYEGYDLNRDKTGDVPFHPVSMYSMIIDNNPSALMLFRSFIVALMDKTERILPGVTPENLKDDSPLMSPLPL
ncbi:MAG: nitrous oxide reductase family maturation protein NosD [Ginsengibacter sp.]